MGLIKDRFPLLAAQEGVWDGQYVTVNADHRVVARHKSRLICRISDVEGEARLEQSNIYFHDDGTQEVRYFDAFVKGDRVEIDTDLINGWIAPVDLDHTGRAMMVAWTRKTDVGFRFYEIITMSRDGESKNRTWHGYHEGQLFTRTLIDEVLVTRDWKDHDKPEYRVSTARQPLETEFE